MSDTFANWSIDHTLLVHGYLLGFAVFSTAVVAAGIIWENGPFEVREVATKLVIWGVAAEALCTVALFVFDEGISTSQQNKIIAFEARPWTKAQFDAIQEIKGKVTDVGLFSEKDCIECRLFADHIELALNAAGVKLYGDDTLDWMRGTTGIHISLPLGSDLFNDPLVVALRNAGLNPGTGSHNPPEWSPVRTDIRVIYVGERSPLLATFPYFPSGRAGWTWHPLKNPNFNPSIVPKPQ